ncbi:hypothetical protein [Parasedimentitalea maritima]|uniref:Cyanovirin-N domain-containing protein n=1 Tax=Parasedimentitalea maritima TaxID=2578117 RepID=A0A6A4RK18_9RHOB|nr:hypothetical protein [Zongyanglinia marina]KAE9632305.1 hypothetical protein GP644_00575 [Zongyanglinia marina]
MNVLHLPAVVCALALTTTNVRAETYGAPNCPMSSDKFHCQRVFACISAETTRWFVGTVIGIKDSTISGNLNDGTICTGKIPGDDDFTRIATLSCADGLETEIVVMDPVNGSIGFPNGMGNTVDGGIVHWASGYAAQDHIDVQTGKLLMDEPCSY